MIHRQRLLFRNCLVALASGAALVASLEFWSLDICADAGGVYQAFTFSCSGVGSDFEHVWSRPWTVWVLILAFPAYIAACAALTAGVLASDAYTVGQKIAQSALLWLLPVLGLAVVAWFRQHGTAPVARPPQDLYPRESDLPG